MTVEGNPITVLTDIKAVIDDGKVIVVETLTIGDEVRENRVVLEDVGGLKGYLNGVGDFDKEDLDGVVED